MNIPREDILLIQGSKAPHIRTVNVEGAPTEVPSSTGRYTLAVFLRHAGCPWCNLTIQILSQMKSQFEQKSCKIVCFVQSDEKIIKSSIAIAKETSIWFPIIADPEMKFYKKYGVNSRKNSLLIQLFSSGAWLRSVIIHRNKIQKQEGAKLLLVPGAFLIDNETENIINLDYDARLYNQQAIGNILKYAEDY